MIEVEQITAALIKVTSKRPVGPFNLIMWMGYPDAVSWDGQSVNESLISIFTAKEYQYANSPVVYARGVANKIKGDCENASCFCTGACMINPPEELARDEKYFNK
tara:strand:+ start:9068 stop:9382 length:315 start_codon:yes stop_codon:yes gene_type:complete